MTDRLPSIMLGSDFYTKPRNRKWINEYGSDAVVIIQTIWIACSQERSCSIPKNLIASISYPIPITEERITAIVESALKIGLLDETVDHYFNSRIAEDHESFVEKRNNYREGWKKRARTQTEHNLNPTKIQKEKSLDYIEPEYEPEDLDLKELSPDLQIEIPKWIEHRIAKKKPLGFSEIDALIMEGKREPEGLLRSLRASRKNGHVTLYPVSDNAKVPQFPGADADFQHVMRLAASHGRGGFEKARPEIPQKILPAIKRIGWQRFCDADPKFLKPLKDQFFEELRK